MLGRWFTKPTIAQIAGKKAGRAWKNILYHTYSDLEELTGLDAYTHACEEAEKWLDDFFAERYRDSRVTYLTHVNKHEMYLEYVEAFLKELAPELETRGQPKE